MGMFDTLKSGGVGFAKVPNKQGYTNDYLLLKLSKIDVSFGKPSMGDITGKQCVLYKNASFKYDIFTRVDGNNIIMGKIGTDGVSSVQTAAEAGLGLMLGHKDVDASEADHAVEELADVITKLQEGIEVTKSTVLAAISTSTGHAINYFMKQKAISLKPKFDIYDEKESAVYHVEGDITRLNFSVQRDGREVIKLKKKLVAILPEYTISIDGQTIGKIKKRLKLTSPELVGTINGKELVIAGDLLAFDYDIKVGGHLIGHIDTAQTIWQDCYRIRIYDEASKDLMIAMAIICDNVVDSEKSN